MSGAEARAGARLPLDAQREHLMVQAAKLHFDLERTQGEIADELGLTRWQVSRLIREAREMGIVRVEIVPRAHRSPALETALQAAFGLREAIVVPDGGSDEMMLDDVARAAGEYLARMQPRPSLIGVSWGRTMAAVAHWLPPHWSEGAHVVLVNGAVTLRGSSARTHAVAEAFAERGAGTATPMPAPAIVGRPKTRAVLEDDPVIAGVLALAERAETVCFGLGALSPQSVLVSSGYLEPADIDRLAGIGAVGDILGRFIDRRGKIVDPALDARTVGLGLDALTRKQRRIGVFSGAAKHAVALAALGAGHVNVAVTDAASATYLLEHASRQQGPK